jgi:hypothetical protein
MYTYIRMYVQVHTATAGLSNASSFETFETSRTQSSAANPRHQVMCNFTRSTKISDLFSKRGCVNQLTVDAHQP